MADEYDNGPIIPYETLSSTGSIIPNTIYVNLFENKDGLKWHMLIEDKDITITNDETTIKFSKDFLSLFKNALDIVSKIDWEQEIEN